MPLSSGVAPPPARHSVSGERKIVTLLFADTVGSTSLIEHIDPEHAVSRLQPVLDAMIDGVHAFGGTVSSVAGDGILALFGAPIAHEDHAVRAAYAALQMLDGVRAATGGTIDIRVGLHTGEVLLRTITTDLSVDYTALGPPVHLASRMERLAEPGQALMTADAARLATGFVVSEPLGPRSVKGLDEPVEVRRLLRRTDAVGTWMPRVRRELTRFVGRRNELATLRQAFARAQRGHGRLTAVTGGAGVGKSRLVHEFLTTLPANVSVRRLQASPYDVSTPYFPLIPLFRGARDARAESDDEVRHRIAADVEALDPQLVSMVIDPVIALIGGQPDSDEWTALDPPRRRRRIRDAVRSLAIAAARRGTEVFVIEDLHWIDEDTQAVLNDIVDIVDGTAIHIVVTYRPEYDDNWTERAFHERVRLDPLLDDQAAELLNALLGSHPSIGRLRHALLTRTDGTPLFVEETVRSLADGGALAGNPGEYRFVGDLDALELPGTVQAVVAARIDRLPRSDKRLLQVAAVIGETVPVELLEATAGDDEHAVHDGSGRLQEAEFLYELDDGSELTFKHNLIREVVYGEIPLERRRLLHGSVADALAATRAPDAPVERLAHHSYHAERWDDAVRYMWRAAQLSERRSAYPQARRLLAMGLDASTRLPETIDHMSRVIDMAGALRVAATGAGQRLQSTLRALDRAATYADRLGDRRRLATVAVHRSYVGSMTGDHRLAVTAARTARQLGNELDDRYLVAEGRLAEGQALAMAGHPRDVPELLSTDLDFLKTAIGADRRGLVTSRISTSLIWIAMAWAQLGRFSGADRVFADRAAIVDADGRPFEMAFGAWVGGTIDIFAGRLQAARVRLTTGLEIAQLHDLTYNDALICAQLGYTQAALGDPEAAMRTLDRAVELAQVAESPYVDGWARVNRAYAHLIQDAPALATADASAARAFARHHDQPLVEAIALRRLGAATTDRAQADAYVRDALAICDREYLVALRDQLPDPAG